MKFLRMEQTQGHNDLWPLQFITNVNSNYYFPTGSDLICVSWKPARCKDPQEKYCPTDGGGGATTSQMSGGSNRSDVHFLHDLTHDVKILHQTPGLRSEVRGHSNTTTLCSYFSGTSEEKKLALGGLEAQWEAKGGRVESQPGEGGRCWSVATRRRADVTGRSAENKLDSERAATRPAGVNRVLPANTNMFSLLSRCNTPRKGSSPAAQWRHAAAAAHIPPGSGETQERSLHQPQHTRLLAWVLPGGRRLLPLLKGLGRKTNRHNSWRVRAPLSSWFTVTSKERL